MKSRHRRIVEWGLAIQPKNSMPNGCWSFAFKITTYLLNMSPTKILHGLSPFKMLYKNLANVLFNLVLWIPNQTLLYSFPILQQVFLFMLMIIITVSYYKLLQSPINNLRVHFGLKNLRKLNLFVGLEVQYVSSAKT